MPNEERPLVILKLKDCRMHLDVVHKCLEEFKNQRERYGIIIVPDWFEPILVPSDVEIKIESEDNNDD